MKKTHPEEALILTPLDQTFPGSLPNLKPAKRCMPVGVPRPASCPGSLPVAGLALEVNHFFAPRERSGQLSQPDRSDEVSSRIDGFRYRKFD